MKESKICFICFEDLAIGVAGSLLERGHKVYLVESSYQDFPRDCDIYVVHLSNVHTKDGKYDPDCLRKLKQENPNCRIYGFSGDFDLAKPIRDILTEARSSFELPRIEEILEEA